MTIKRHFSPTKQDNLRSISLNMNWEAVHFNPDTEAAFNIFQGALQISPDIAFPKKKSKIKRVCYENGAKSLKDDFLRTLFKY